MDAVLKLLKFVAAGWPTRVIAALVAIGVGQIVYVVALISIIGIPVALAFLALPALASLYIAGELVHQLSRVFRRGPAKPVSRRTVAVLVTAASFIAAQAANLHIGASARALTAGDFARRDAAPIDRFALTGDRLRDKDEKFPACDSLCLRLLISGAVKEVILTGPVDPAAGPSAGARAIAAKFEQRGVCAQQFYFPSAPSPLVARGKALVGEYAAYEEARRRQDEGHCLVETETRLGAAEAVLAQMETRQGKSAASAGFDLLADTRTATQLSLYRRKGAVFEEISRRTVVRYEPLLFFAAPTYLHSYGLDTKLGFARWTSYLNARGRQYGSAAQKAFVTEVMGLDLEPATGDRAE